MRRLCLLRSLWTAILLSILCLPAQAQVRPSDSGSPCANCHRAQASAAPQTPMGRALFLTGANPTLKANPKLTVRKGDYTYTVETQGEHSTYSVSDGKSTITLPILWNFGAGAQTWVLEREGQWYEGLVSYYPDIKGLDTTIGDDVLTPHTLEDAVGRLLLPSETKDCFGCHSTKSAQNGRLNLAALQPGVTCEHCHAGTTIHLSDALQGEFTSTPPKLGKLSSEDLTSFCGQCHRTWDTVVRNRWHGVMVVRFQPYRLANSKCFDGADPRISCLACHDPHQEVVRQESSYDSKCLACHASSVPLVSAAALPSAASTGKSCPVSKSNCVSCHMPKVTLPGGHMKFTDHEIRIVKAGEKFPD